MQSLIIDNYDSFTYNLVQLIAEINGIIPIVIKNDQMSWQEVSLLDCDNMIISPGPGHPNSASDFGICHEVLLKATVPVLGICLGHQGLYCAYGGKVGQAPQPMHGRFSKIIHNNDPLFHRIPQKFQVVRYHSLMAEQPIPDSLIVTAWTSDGIIMGIRHKSKPIWGIQFHPESICTEFGCDLLTNFKKLTKQYRDKKNQISFLKKSSVPFSTTEKKANSIIPTHFVQVKKLSVFVDPEIFFKQVYIKNNPIIWLDSSKILPGISRFSFIGCVDGPLSYAVNYDLQMKEVTIDRQQTRLKKKISIFDFLKQELSKIVVNKMDLPFNFIGGFVGYFGYELKSETLNVQNKHISDLPDAQFLFLDRIIVFDHKENEMYLVALSINENVEEAVNWFLEMENKIVSSKKKSDVNLINTDTSDTKLYEFFLSRDKKTYMEDIQKCFQHIKCGDSYELCLTNKMKLNDSIDPLQYYNTLRRISAAPYSAFLQFDQISIACSSMERFLQIDTNCNVETRPIKGTMPRGVLFEEDQQNIDFLATDKKFQSENLMIVDVLRNDLGKVCEMGSVKVPFLMQIETYETLHQLVSTVRGTLCNDVTAIDCIKAVFPGGSMTGAPKVRSVNIIDEIETEARGIYSGALGYLSINGSVDLNIVIRTAEIRSTQLSIGLGGAIIALSDPEEEYEEILLKGKQLRNALINNTLKNNS